MGTEGTEQMVGVYKLNNQTSQEMPTNIGIKEGYGVIFLRMRNINTYFGGPNDQSLERRITEARQIDPQAFVAVVSNQTLVCQGDGFIMQITPKDEYGLIDRDGISYSFVWGFDAESIRHSKDALGI